MMGGPISRVRPTGLIRMTPKTGGPSVHTQVKNWTIGNAGNLNSTPLWPERVKLSVFFFFFQDKRAGWMASSECLFFPSSSRRWAMALIQYSRGGGRWMGFIKSGIGVVVVSFFSLLFFLLFFL